MSNKLWGGRYHSATNAEVLQYTSSIAFDKELACEDILGSMAHANMLKHHGIITDEENIQLQTGLANIAQQLFQNQLQ